MDDKQRLDNRWGFRILMDSLSNLDEKARRIGALVRLVREAREFVMSYDEEWGPGDPEAVAWLSEARALVSWLDMVHPDRKEVF